MKKIRVNRWWVGPSGSCRNREKAN